MTLDKALAQSRRVEGREAFMVPVTVTIEEGKAMVDDGNVQEIYGTLLVLLRRYPGLNGLEWTPLDVPEGTRYFTMGQ